MRLGSLEPGLTLFTTPSPTPGCDAVQATGHPGFVGYPSPMLEAVRGRSPIRVAMVGPALDGRGGITSVIRSYLSAGFSPGFEVSQVSTWNGSGLIRISVSFATGAARLVRGLAKGRWDVVHLHSSQGASFLRKSLLVRLVRLFGVPTVFHIHGHAFDRLLVEGPRWRRSWARSALEKSTVVVVLSDEWRARIGSLVPAANIRTVPNGVVMPALKASNPVGPVVSTGLLGERKGSYVMVEAAARLPDVHMVLAGGGETESVREFAQAKDLGERVETPGWLGPAECSELLSTASVYALPSRAEGLPMGLLEAMSFGLPVISSPVGGIPSLIEDGVNGLLVPPDDPVALADAISRLLNEPGLGDRLGDHARSTIREHYTVEVAVDLLQEIWVSITSTHPEATV